MSDTTTVTPTLGLRHLVLWVTDPEASAVFYEQALGLHVKARMGEMGVFMASSASATDHDLALFRAPVTDRPDPRQIGMYHTAWEVGTLEELDATIERLQALGAVVGLTDHGVSKSVYAQDPDGLEFEVMWEVPLDQVDDDAPRVDHLDLAAAKARYGADTPGRGLT
ncbi:MAG: VOC family protein [Actinomycetota bacterium]